MAKIVKKVKKLGARGSGASSRETSPLRPLYVEKAPPCGDGCPNHNQIRRVLRIVNDYDYKHRGEEETWTEAFRVLSETTPLPASCGRVCPALCAQNCNRKDVDEPVNIRCIERYIGDFAIEHGLGYDFSDVPRQKEKVAVIGSGPAGLSCAFHLAKQGYAVTVYEAFPKAGGMLRYGIPDYRLPPDVLDAEIKRLTDAGIRLVTGTMVGKDIPYEQLRQEYDAIFVGIGAHKGKVLGVPGEDADNVMTGTGFLNLVNQGQPVEVGKHVIVIGGGDTAIDAARISRRLGAEVTIVYRRTETEMPAIAEEIHEARNEGVRIEFLAAPLEVLRANGRATGMRFQRMELGEPDSSGRRRPVPVAGSEFSLDASFIIPAISQEPDFAPLEHLHEGKDWIKIDREGHTPEAGVYAGGDAVELGLVTIALAQGRQAADAIHRAFRGLPAPAPSDKPKVDAGMLNRDFWERQPAAHEELLPVSERFGTLGREVASTVSAEQARAEAKRCMSCGLCFDCENCFKFCQDNAVVRPLNKGEAYHFKLEFCQGCKKCAEQCPCGYIDMK